MQTLSWKIKPELFVLELQQAKLRWRKRASHGPSGKRHSRDLLRSWIRWYKKINGIELLPQVQFPADTAQWREAAPASVKVELLPHTNDTGERDAEGG